MSGLLDQAGVRGPYVLLGHSLGGQFAEYFAARHPGQVAGLILEESRPADFARRCVAARLEPCAPAPALTRLMPPGAQAEVAAMALTATEVESAGRLAGKPVLVLSRPLEPQPTPPARLWRQAQIGLAARYPGAQRRVAPGGGHYVHKDQPLWFAAAVGDFLAGAR